jgi:hypothetical protein
MTEQALLPAAADFDSPAKSNSRVMLLAAGAGVLALLVAAYFLFFTGGSSDLPMGKVSLPKAKTVHSAPKSVAKKPAAAKVVPATFTGVHSKDPFKPLVQAPPAPAATAAPAGGGATTPVQVVTLTGVGISSATVTVNGSVFKPSVGSSFANYFKLLKMQGTSCATFLYGDESFDLCKGNTTTKQ